MTCVGLNRKTLFVCMSMSVVRAAAVSWASMFHVGVCVVVATRCQVDLDGA